MKIKINGKEFIIFEYDDGRTILERYSITQQDSLPIFYRIDGSDFILEEGSSIKTADVRDTIKKMTHDALLDKAIIEGLLISYPGLKRGDIGILWIKSRYAFEGRRAKTDIAVDELKTLDRHIFSSSLKAEAAVLDFDTNMKIKRDQIKKKIENEDRIFSQLSKQRAVPVDPFITEETTSQIVLRLEGKETILDVFNAMDVSKNIPFIFLVYKRRKYYKVYSPIIPPDSWVDFEPEGPGIYFKVLNVPTGKLVGRQIMLENLYSNVIWHPEDRVEVNFRVKHGITEADMKAKIFNSLGDRIKYEILTTRQTTIKGTFTIPDIDFNRVIFADLVHTDATFKHFLFFNEKQKTAFNKPRFYVYYTPNQQGVSHTSLTLTITPKTATVSREEGETASAVVRVSHASNFQQANAARAIFSKLLTIYNSKFEEVVEFYTGLIPNFKTKASIFQKKAKKKEDKKTGPRAMALRKFKPDLFGSRYPDQCQKEKQPYIIKSQEEAEALALKLADMHKIMYFDGSWYACDPREPDDKNFKHLYPGLKQNTSKLDKNYKDKFELLPCCYTQDQYEKAASQLRLYYKDSDHAKEEIARKDRESGMGYIVGQNKKLDAGRYGEMPFNWEKLLAYLQVEKVVRGRQTVYPYLRHGVLTSPDSFFHCLERAFNTRYISMVAEDKRKTIIEVRKRIMEANTSLIVGRQELYDHTTLSMRSALGDPEQYIDPRKWVGVASAHYKCNIYLYVVDSENPNGNIVIPENSQAYLPKEHDNKYPTVLIVMYETDTEDYPYQCEIICKIHVVNGAKIKRVEYSFGGVDIVDMAVSMMKEANRVFVVDVNGYKPYINAS